MKKSLATLLYEEFQHLEVFRDERDQHHVVLREGGAPVHLPLHGKPFLHLLRERAFALTGQVPSQSPLVAVIQMLETKARAAPRVRLWNRVARGPDGALWLDLLQGQAARVTAAGWTVEDAPALFHRYSHQLPLPRPERGGDLRRLCRLLNLKTETDQALYLASLVAALVPDVPQPILILSGPQGAAKTTAARLRRALIDPSVVGTVMVRRDLAELSQALDHHYMPVFDNLSALSSLQEEVLCQAATGAAFTKRRLFTDQEDVISAFYRPLILTGINLPSATPDLLDRAILIQLERIDPAERKDEAVLWRAFHAELPQLLGALLSALAEAMEIEGELEFSELGRMADFTRWGTAGAMALGYEGNFFLAALHRNVLRQGEEVIDDDPVAEAVRALVAREGLVVATPSKLLSLLAEVSGPAGLPRQAAELSRRLNRLRAPLCDLGIHLKPARGQPPERQRLWVLASKEEA